MKIMESSDSSRELLDNVTMTEVSAPFMMQRIGVEPSQLLSGELLPSHGGLVVDMTNNEYLPAVSYATDDLLDHDLTEEDRNLAAALVAVQLVQQQKQQQLHQDSNVIVSTNSLASLVSSSNLENGKVELGEQLVISSVDKPVISSINNTYINIEERHHLHHHDSILKKYGNITVEPIRNEFISIKNENDESMQQRDSDCENKSDVRSSKKSLPHKKRISRKLQKKLPVSKKGHKCTMCEQAFNTAEELNAHSACHAVNIVVQPNPFSCQICGLICNDQLSFFQHLKSHYEPTFHTIPMGSSDTPTKEIEPNTNNEQRKDSFFSPSLYCKECGKNFRRQKAFDAHMENAHNKIEDEFSEPEDLMEGIRGVVEANHDDDTDEDVPPDSKGWHYTTALQATETNLQDVQNQEQVCHLCGQIFHSNEEVIQHLQECKATVETKLEQTSDAEEQDPGGKSRVRKKRRKNGTLFCPHCDRVFSHRNSLMYHMRGHTGERPHQCDICGKSFFAASALKVHMRLHSGDKPYKCEYCGRHFRQWGDLKYHCISIHSDEKNYQCEYCGKDFARKYSLIVHRRIHTGEKNYRCEFCGKTFRASSYLQNHRRIHTGEKPHPCEICGKPFRVRSDMKRHLNTHARRKNSGPAPRTPTDTTNTNTSTTNTNTTTTVIELTEGDSSNIVGDEDRLLEAHDDQVSEESDVQYQVSRDPLETVRDGANTLFNNGHLLICYPSELQARTAMETQWVNSDS